MTRAGLGQPATTGPPAAQHLTHVQLAEGTPVDHSTHQELAGRIWQVADLLRGDYKQSDYGKVILPFAVLRRMECVLEPSREAVRQEKTKWFDKNMNPDPFLRKASGHRFYNTSKLTLQAITAAPDDAAKNLLTYIGAFSENAREVFDKYEFTAQIAKLASARLLHQVVARFADFDLHPDRVSNHQMGYAFEELIRKFAEASNETAGEHFTPREVIRLMTALLVAPDTDALSIPVTIRTVLDPACGTGGMLSAVEDYIRDHNPDANVVLFGQELNPESWAICRSDLMIKDQEPKNI
jgi:type I restriction enzyme M protein